MNCARARPSFGDDGIQRIDPVARLISVAIRKLLLEVPEVVEHLVSSLGRSRRDPVLWLCYGRGAH